MDVIPVPLQLFSVVMATLIVVLGLAFAGLRRLDKAVDQSDPG